MVFNFFGVFIVQCILYVCHHIVTGCKRSYIVLYRKVMSAILSFVFLSCAMLPVCVVYIS